MLRVEDLHWSFEDVGDRREILCGLDISFEAGHAVAVTGPSGCGKTTLLSILSLLCRPRRGRIVFRGAEVSLLGRHEAGQFRREHIGLVFQSPRLIEQLTIGEQIRFASHLRGRPVTQRLGLALLERFGLAHTIERLPGQLSGGEKQRVAIALALMFRPAIVLADEPTASLDETNTAAVARVLQEYALEEEAVVVAASHDATLIQRFSAELPLAEHLSGVRAPLRRRGATGG